MKRLLALLLATVLALSIFAGCQNGTDSETTTEPEEPETFVTTTLIQGGASECVIVHDGTSGAKTLANEIRTAILKNFGVTLTVVEKDTKEAACEIVVGQAREIVDKTMEKLTGQFDFAVKVEENKLVLCAKDAFSYLYLTEYLKREVLVKPDSGDLVLDSDDNIVYSRSALMEKNYIDYCRDAGKQCGLEEIFSFEQYQNEKTTLPYRLYVPFNYSPDKSYPLLVNLHGAGHRGNDNIKHLGTIKPLMNMTETQADDVIIVVPQCPENKKWVNTGWGLGSYRLQNVPETNEMKAVVELIGQLQETYNVDDKRIYASGFSMGGYGTWNLLMNHPDLFCAGVAMCGAGDPTKGDVLAKIPIWAIHGAKDPTVPVQGSRDMVNAIQSAGGTKLNYTELPDHEHDVWNYTYSNAEIFNWLFSQVKE